MLYVLYCTTDKEKLNITPFAINFISKGDFIVTNHEIFDKFTQSIKSIELIKGDVFAIFPVTNTWETHFHMCHNSKQREATLVHAIFTSCCDDSFRLESKILVTNIHGAPWSEIRLSPSAILQNLQQMYIVKDDKASFCHIKQTLNITSCDVSKFEENISLCLVKTTF
jgi:hypothetical protein